MRYVVLFVLFATFGAVLVLGFVVMVRELLTRDVFDAPALPDSPAKHAELERDSTSHSATPLS
jgi:hypothetical protein